VRIEDRRAAGLHLDSLVDRGQPAAFPERGAAVGVAFRVAQYDVCGRILVFGAERVTDPRAEGRPAGKDLKSASVSVGSSEDGTPQVGTRCLTCCKQ